MTQFVWLITGCSSGFGELLVRQILSRGDNVIATGRRLDSLKGAEEAGASILQLDVTDQQQDLDKVMAKAIAIYGRIDVLVNNAGYIAPGAWEDLESVSIASVFTIPVTKTNPVLRVSWRNSTQTSSGSSKLPGPFSRIFDVCGRGPWCSSAPSQGGTDTHSSVPMLVPSLHSKVISILSHKYSYSSNQDMWTRSR